MTFISDDLTWLLQQNHTKFWCEVRTKIYISLLNIIIDFRSLLIKIFIQCLIPIYDMHHGKYSFKFSFFRIRLFTRPQRTSSSNTYSFVSNGKQLEENVSRLMFMCILRLSTHKESSVCLDFSF